MRSFRPPGHFYQFHNKKNNECCSWRWFSWQLFFILNSIDAYSTRDIIYAWEPEATEVVVGNTEMAQFEYKGSKLSKEVDVFSVGKYQIRCVADIHCCLFKWLLLICFELLCEPSPVTVGSNWYEIAFHFQPWFLQQHSLSSAGTGIFYIFFLALWLLNVCPKIRKDGNMFYSCPTPRGII